MLANLKKGVQILSKIPHYNQVFVIQVLVPEELLQKDICTKIYTSSCRWFFHWCQFGARIWGKGWWELTPVKSLFSEYSIRFMA